MKALFICNQNKHRSKTAEQLFSKQFQTQSAGLYSETPVSKLQINWADVIFVMEDIQISEIAKRFPEQYLQKRIINLNIPDCYHFNQPELVELLKTRMKESL